MKKFLFLSIFCSLFLAGFSQAYDMKSQYNLNTDTVVAAVKYLKSSTIASYKTIAVVSIVGTKISGTVGGTAVLQGSLDGVNFYDMGQSAITLTDVASQVVSFHVTNIGDPYLRIKFTPTGTMSVKVSAKYLTR